MFTSALLLFGSVTGAVAPAARLEPIPRPYIKFDFENVLPVRQACVTVRLNNDLVHAVLVTFEVEDFENGGTSVTTKIKNELKSHWFDVDANGPFLTVWGNWDHSANVEDVLFAYVIPFGGLEKAPLPTVAGFKGAEPSAPRRAFPAKH